MVDISDSEAFAFATNYSGSGSWLDEANSHDAAFPGGTNDPTHFTHDGTNYARLPGEASNTLTTPDVTAWDIVDNGDIDIRVRVLPEDDTPAAIQYLISKGPAGGATGWGAYIDTDGTVVFEMGDGTNRIAASTVASSIGTVTPTWLGLTYDSSAGLANLYKSATNDADITGWTQIGDADIAISGGTTATNNDDDVEIGSSAGAERFIGRIYDVEVRDGINGTEIGGPNAADVDETDIVAGTHTDGQSKVWTMNQSGTGELIRWVNRPHFHFNTDDFLQIPDDNQLDFNAEDFTLGIGLRSYAWNTGVQQRLLDKRGASGDGYLLEMAANTNVNFQHVSDGSPAETEASPADGTASTFIAVNDWDGDGDLKAWVSGANSAGTAKSGDGNLTNARVLEIGAFDSGSNRFFGEIWSWSVNRAALSDTEVGTGTGTLHDSLLNQTQPGAVITAPFLEPTNLYAPQVDLNIPMAFLEPVNLYAPDLPQEITAPFLQPVSLFAPQVGFVITAPFLQAAFVYTIRIDLEITAPFLEPTNLYAPQVDLEITAPFLQAATVYAPTVARLFKLVVEFDLETSSVVSHDLDAESAVEFDLESSSAATFDLDIG